MTIKEKIQQYIDCKGISVYRLEASAGLSKGYWSKTKSISADVVMKISRIYTDISAEWLLRGTGSMFITDKPSSLETSSENAEITRLRIENNLLREMVGLNNSQKEKGKAV